MIIYLVGYMGSGKSSAGKRLASRLNYPFIDLDEEFERIHGKTVSVFMDERGEETFRQKESEILRNLSIDKDLVVATGGGAPCFHSNMEFMNSTGVSIYLKLHPKSLFTRISDSKTQRPLLRNLTGDTLMDFIQKHLDEREAFYSRAKIVIKGENLQLDDLLTQLAQ